MVGIGSGRPKLPCPPGELGSGGWASCRGEKHVGGAEGLSMNLRERGGTTDRSLGNVTVCREDGEGEGDEGATRDGK